MMGTVCEIKVYARFYPKKAINAAFAEMKRIESLANFYGSGDIAKINQGEDILVSSDILNIIKESIKISEMTDGAFDITIAPVIELWNFNTQKIPDKAKIDSALKLVNYKWIKLDGKKVSFKKKGMKINLSGIAAGYAVDLAVDKLKSYGIKKGLVNCGGDIRVFGNKIWKIGIKNPRADGIIKVLKLKNKAVTTSGDYEKYFIKDGLRYSHILDPKTGYPSKNCISVSVIADKCILADALATGIFVMPIEKSKKLLDSLDIQAVIITPDLKIIEKIEK